MSAPKGEFVAKAAFTAAHHADHQPHQPTGGFHDVELQVGTPHGAPPKVEFLNGKMLVTAEGDSQPQEVPLPEEAYTNETVAKWNASTAKLKVSIMLKDPNSPAMLEKKALDPDGPRPRPVEVQVTGQPLQRPPDVVGHGQPTPAQVAAAGASTSPAIVGGPKHAVMPQSGLAGTVASDMPTMVHKGGALEAPCSGETVVRDYETSDTRMEVPQEVVKDLDKLTSGMGKQEIGSGAMGQGPDLSQMRHSDNPLQQDIARGRVLAPAGTTVVQGARERRIEAEFETADGGYLSAARTAMHLPKDEAPEHGAPTASVESVVAPTTAGAGGMHAEGGAEMAPERGGMDVDLMKEGTFPTPAEAQQEPVGAEGAAIRAAAEDGPELAGRVDAAAQSASGIDTGAEMAPEAAAGGGTGFHCEGGAECAPERANLNIQLLKEEGITFPSAPAEAPMSLEMAPGAKAAQIHAAAEDLPESGTGIGSAAAGTTAQNEGQDTDMAPAAGAMGGLTLGDVIDAGGRTLMESETKPHALAPAGEAEEGDEPGEEYDYEDEYEEGPEYFEEYEDEHGVMHVSTDPSKEKVGMATHPLTAAEMYPRADDGSYEPVSTVKHQVEEGGHGCDVCCCSPCQCDKMRKGQYKTSLEMSQPEMKRSGKPALKKVKKPDSGKKPAGHGARDCRMHARTANAAQPHMSMAARTTAWTGNVALNPAPGVTINASEIEQKVMHHGSSLRRPAKAEQAQQAAIGADNDADAMAHGSKHHESTYTGGRLIGTGPNIHLSTGRHDKKSHVLG